MSNQADSPLPLTPSPPSGVERPDEPPLNPFEDSYVLVDRFGAFLGKHSERVRVSIKGETLLERPLFGLEQILVSSPGVSISSDLIAECAQRGICLSFLDWTGHPYATLFSSDLVGTAQTRRSQLLAYHDERGIKAIKGFATGKLGNQAGLLKYMAKYRKTTGPAVYEAAREASLRIDELQRQIRKITAPHLDEARSALLTIEAQAGRLYWEAARQLLIPDLGWEDREHRGAQDVVNAALNYGYGILASEVERAIILAGLDPYAGFLHADRSGRPSLVLDLIEEFRQASVDRALFAYLNRGGALSLQDGRLDEPSRRAIVSRVKDRLATPDLYQRRKHKLRSIVQMQARRLAVFLRGEEESYRPFIARW